MAAPKFPPVPFLEPGDYLTRDEFERRYNAMPNLEKAELIEGVVYMPSPVRLDYHGIPHADLMTWLGVYRAATPGVRAADNTSIRLDLTNEPQPDGTLIILPAHGGRVRISEDGYVEGAPELIGEAAASTASIDLHAKLHAYRRSQVQEYIVWRVLDQAIDWFTLWRKQYKPLPLPKDGTYRSRVFPGLWLDPAALTRGDLSTVLRVLQRGLASAEHAAFTEHLQQAAAH